MNGTRETLSSARKARKVPPGYVTTDELKSFGPKHTIPSLHASSPAGTTSLAVSHLNRSQFLTGGNDKIVQLYDRSTDKVLASLKGKKVNHVAFQECENDPTLLLSGGADKFAKMWSFDSSSHDYTPRLTITGRTHKGEITGVAVHPTNTVAILSSLDHTFCARSIQFHPSFPVHPV